jgi:hypothetical protein
MAKSRKAREHMKRNHVQSFSVFVESSVCEERARLGHEKTKSALFSAGNDPLVMADVMEIQLAFEHTDHEAMQ